LQASLSVSDYARICVFTTIALVAVSCKNCIWLAVVVACWNVI